MGYKGIVKEDSVIVWQKIRVNESDEKYIQEVVESILREKGVKPKRFHFTITIHYEE